jgi:predicted 3-demethylubiquinone-9 3-methyltransferase (glyoxalase superfamily)
MSKIKIAPFLWYVNQAEEAAAFYTSIFPDSRINKVFALQADSPSGPAGSVKVVDFTLFGEPYYAMGAGPFEPFNHAISLCIFCDDQAEIDKYYNALLEGGTAEPCGWLKDRYGLSWQITPAIWPEMMGNSDKAAARRAAEAMMKMQKFDIAALKKAFENG